MIALLLGVSLLSPSTQAAPLPTSTEALREKARECERKGQWTDACRLYDEVLKRERTLTDKDAYQRCLRHVLQARRHRDATFRQSLLSLKLPQAAEVYEDVLVKLRNHYIERERAEVVELFRLGLDEFTFALEDEVFLKEHLSRVPRETVDGFRGRLEQWRHKDLATTREARDQVLAVATAARRSLGLEPSVVVLEFACGACNGLDEYTTYLTPAMLHDAQTALKGELVGIGIQLQLIDQKLLVSQVFPDTDAFEKQLRPGDRITQIDRQPVEQGGVEAALARLQGEAGTAVTLTVIPLNEVTARTIKVLRRPLLVRSVEPDLIIEDDIRIGVARILAFHENTVQELRDALVRLQTMGMDVLILDLRGNPGGLFRPAIQVAELFLADGVIVLTHSRLRGYNRTYKAENPNPFDVPLVVLVDGDTASAAEVVAGALKENQRATLVGQTTFGKGSIQAVLALEKITAGIRLTVARFYSPANYPYAGRGVNPHEVVDAGAEAQLVAARQVARRLAMMMPR